MSRLGSFLPSIFGPSQAEQASRIASALAPLPALQRGLSMAQRSYTAAWAIRLSPGASMPPQSVREAMTIGGKLIGDLEALDADILNQLRAAAVRAVAEGRIQPSQLPPEIRPAGMVAGLVVIPLVIGAAVLTVLALYLPGTIADAMVRYKSGLAEVNAKASAWNAWQAAEQRRIASAPTGPGAPPIAPPLPSAPTPTPIENAAASVGSGLTWVALAAAAYFLLSRRRAA